MPGGMSHPGSKPLSASGFGDHRAAGGEYDYSDAEMKVRLQQGLSKTSRCGLCEQVFNTPKLPYTISLKAILDVRLKWGATTQQALDQMHPSMLYNLKQICRFCGKFFDIDPDEVDLRQPEHITDASVLNVSWTAPTLSSSPQVEPRKISLGDTASSMGGFDRWVNLEVELAEFRVRNKKLRPKTKPFSPPPVIARTDAKAGLPGRLGAAYKFLRSGSRCQALVTSEFFCKGDLGTVWRTGKTRVVVRMDGARAPLVLKPSGFCYSNRSKKGQPAQLVRAQSIGGNVRKDLPLSDISERLEGTDFVMRLLSTGPEDILDTTWDTSPEETNSCSDVLVSGPSFAAADACVSDDSSLASGYNVITTFNLDDNPGFDLNALTVAPKELLRVTAAASVASAMCVFLYGFRECLFTPIRSYSALVMRPTVSVSPPHSAHLCDLVAKIFRATIIESNWERLPVFSDALTTIFVFNPTTEALGRLMIAARRCYPATVIVTDSVQMPLAATSYHNPASLPPVVVVHGAQSIWNVLHDIQRSDINVESLPGNSYNDPWDRELLIRRPLHLRVFQHAPAVCHVKYPFTAMVAVSLLKSMAGHPSHYRRTAEEKMEGYDPCGEGSDPISLLFRNKEESVSLSTGYANSGVVLGCTAKEVVGSLQALASFLRSVLGVSGEGMQVSPIPLVCSSHSPLSILVVHSDLTPLLAAVRDKHVAALAGIPVVDVVDMFTVTLSGGTGKAAPEYAFELCRTALTPAHGKNTMCRIISFLPGTPPGSGTDGKTIPAADS